MRPRLGTFYSTWTGVDGLEMHAKVSVAPDPPADAPTVVIVHGLGLSHRYLMPTAERLAPLARVFVPDLPGFGKSDKPERVLDVTELGDVLAAWMRGWDRTGHTAGQRVRLLCRRRVCDSAS